MNGDFGQQKHRPAEFFGLHPVFRTEQFHGAFPGTAKRGSRANRLHYFVSKGRILPLSRRAYAVVPPGQSAGEFKPSRYLVASILRPDAVLAYHTALELLGHAHSVSRVLYGLTSGPARKSTWDGYTFRYVGHPPILQSHEQRHLGVISVEVGSTTVRATGPERTLVDCVTCPKYAGGIEEALVSLRGVPLFDFPLLEQYLAALRNPRVFAAVGAFLELESRRLFVPGDLLARLEGHRPRGRTYLERAQRGGVLLKRWNLIVPHVFIKEEDSLEI